MVLIYEVLKAIWHSNSEEVALINYVINSTAIKLEIPIEKSNVS